MATYSLLFANGLQAADASAVIDWQWQRTDELHSEYRRPDNNERVRYVHDLPGTLSGLRWNTQVYLGRGWRKRRDASEIMGLVDAGCFRKGDPELPPPRPRRRRDDQISEIKRALARLGEI